MDKQVGLQIADNEHARVQAAIAWRWARRTHIEAEEYYQEIMVEYLRTSPEGVNNVRKSAHFACSHFFRWSMGARMSERRSAHLTGRASPGAREASDRGLSVLEVAQVAYYEWERSRDCGQPTLYEIAEYGEAMRLVGEAARRMRVRMRRGRRLEILGEIEDGTIDWRSPDVVTHSESAMRSQVRAELRKHYDKIVAGGKAA